MVNVELPKATEVYGCICSLKRRRAPGPDDLPRALFKDGGEVLSQRLSDLFACIWEKESVPDNWGESVIEPIFKKRVRGPLHASSAGYAQYVFEVGFAVVSVRRGGSAKHTPLLDIQTSMNQARPLRPDHFLARENYPGHPVQAILTNQWEQSIAIHYPAFEGSTRPTIVVRGACRTARQNYLDYLVSELPVDLYTAAEVGVQRLNEGQEFMGDTFAPESPHQDHQTPKE
ncbi:hypothetical protein T265_04422 [Opisthorchis viverrini]|uniref:Uncharacterized protein n=1 Tax=Opisthorchis viverrini TaxID=6198 RepID=A0A074ZZT8_OPIVI|nr:hypothetical protein T265_04422 [Opisthorchis viverrini]KER28815.1 hypothetical protein T265_04422 [Opisthorchis viverrini]